MKITVIADESITTEEAKIIKIQISSQLNITLYLHDEVVELVSDYCGRTNWMNIKNAEFLHEYLDTLFDIKLPVLGINSGRFSL